MDKVIKALDGNIRIIACNSTQLVKEVQQRHVTSPTATASLGRATTAVAMMGTMLKQNQRVSLIIDGSGLGGKLISESDENGNVRSYVSKPQVVVPVRETDGKLDVAKFVGTNGTLKVIKDLNLKEPFTGEVELQNGEIALDLTYYFTVSEQTPSVVSLGVYVNKDAECEVAGGLIIQLLPSHTEEDIVRVEEILGTLKPISQILGEDPSPKNLVNKLFPECRIVSESDIRFKCNCSVDKMQVACSMLPQEEIEETIAKDGKLEVKCKFCNATHHFNKDLEVINNG